MNGEEVKQLLQAFPTALVFVEKRGQADSNYLGRLIEQHEAEIKATYIGLIQQDAPELVEALGVNTFPTLILFRHGEEVRRATIEDLLDNPVVAS